MTVSLDAGVITLSGSCGVEEVETLVNYLENSPDAVVDVGAATSIHTALWQALMVFRPAIAGSPDSTTTNGKVFSAINAYIRGNGRGSA